MGKRKSIWEVTFAIYEIFLLFVFLKLLPLFLKSPVAAGLIFFVAMAVPALIIIYLKKSAARKFFGTKDSLQKIRSLTPGQFEEFIADLFLRLGYSAETVGGSGDGGIDVVATKDGIKHYIQCKKFITQQVSVGAVRDFYGAITDRLSDGKAFFITTNIFTLDAEKFAEDKPIELVDGKKLMEYVRMAGLESTIQDHLALGQNVAEKCPCCGGILQMRVARKGPNSGQQFYGCSNYPSCKFTRNIS
jgi:restriction system protein